MPSETIYVQDAPPLHDAGDGSAVLPTFEIFGMRVHAIEREQTMALLHSWIRNPQPRARFVAFTAMHGVAEARVDQTFRQTLNAADLVVADGTPIMWVARLKGHRMKRRVSGCDLMDDFCRESGAAYRHFFYGGAPGTAETLAATLASKFGIVVAGTYTPPFRPMTESEERELSALVQRTAPDVIWVGLSSPKQEKFMVDHRETLGIPLFLGVGAAFDLNSGNVSRAPAWMGDNGLEWLYRLVSEPRRLWKRYLVTIPTAMWFILLELLGLYTAPGAHESQRPATELGNP